MGKRLECIVSDLDGTLLNPDSEISEEDSYELLRIQEKGIPIVLATGRPYFYVSNFEQKLHITTPLICNNGSIIMHEGMVLRSWAMDPILCEQLILNLIEHKIPFSVHTYDGVYRSGSPPANLIIDIIKDPSKKVFYRHIDDLQMGPDMQVFKISIFGVLADKVREMIDYLSGLKKIQVAASGYGVLDITSANASKGKALKYVAEYIRVDLNNTVVFGDNENDISMFQVAKYSVAMGNSPAELKSASSFVTLTNKESGVSYALNTFFCGMLL